METIQKIIKEGDFILIYEGAVATKMEEACMIGGQPMNTLLIEALQRAEVVVAAGTCATLGGIPASEGNVTGAVGLGAFMRSKNIPVERRLVNCPGCPMHADSLLATIAYVAAKQFPKLDPERLTPDVVYKHSVHDDCPRFHYWQKEVFARRFGEEGCLFKLGCLGPLSHTNCPQRQWNGGVNWCIRAGAPCIACTSQDFARKTAFAFYRKGEKYHTVGYKEEERKGDVK